MVAIIVLDVAMQTQAILNQSRVFAVSHQARSRLNTAYVAGIFAGGAPGSAAAAVLSLGGRGGRRSRPPAWF
ncbi:hypothetical protein ACQP1P_17935 [Dactylosporangium sp. CA-052675]|uniref:hypothetical protein n=1 Tax=Dactylosporangium sp. CA-052675 TaxID=3239927 RepID=UPI003D8BB0D6